MRYTTLFPAALLGALLGLSSATLAQPVAVLSISGGTATDQLGRGSSAIAVAPRVGLPLAPGANLVLSGTATRFATDAWSLGAGTELAARQGLGRFAALTLNGAATASYLGGSATGQFAAADLVPALELRAARVRLYGGARLAAGLASESQPAGGVPPLGGRVDHVSRSGTGAVLGALLDVADDPSRSATIGVREDRLAVDGQRAVDRVITAAISFGRGGISGSLGRRVAADETRTISSVALTLPIGGAAALEIGAGRYASNRVLGTPGGDYATAGISWSFGGDREWKAPVPARAARPAPGATRLAIRAPGARSVVVAGDFNEWKPVAARRADNDVWYVDLRIPPGRYRYAFRVDGSEWRVPDGATAVDDGFGGRSAWLVVQEPGSR